MKPRFILVACIGLLSLSISACGQTSTPDYKVCPLGMSQADEDVARDGKLPVEERFDTSWLFSETKKPHPRFFSRNLLKKHQNDKPSLKVERIKQFGLPVLSVDAISATKNGVYLGTCLKDCQPQRIIRNRVSPTDLVFADPDKEVFTKIADTGSKEWAIKRIFLYGDKGVGWIEHRVGITTYNPEKRVLDDYHLPWRIKACPDAKQCKPVVLYEENSGKTSLNCKYYFVNGDNLLCWFHKENSETKASPWGKYSLFHLDMSASPAKAEILLKDLPFDYDFFWRDSQTFVLIGQWGCKKFACTNYNIKDRWDFPVQFRQTSFKDFPKYKVIKTLGLKTNEGAVFASGDKYVTWQDTNYNPIFVGYSDNRKFFNIDDCDSIKVLGEASRMDFALPSERFIIYATEEKKLWVVNPKDNTQTLLVNYSYPLASPPILDPRWSVTISGNYIYWLIEPYRYNDVTLDVAEKDGGRPILHKAVISAVKP